MSKIQDFPTHTVFLIRGLPGSGKTTAAGQIYRDRKDIIVSADDFMVGPDGEYEFDFRRLAECHNKCQATVKNALDAIYHTQRTDPSSEKKPRRIIVHNTFCERWEMQPYFDLVLAAHRDGFKNLAVTVLSIYDGGLTDEQLAKNNVHGVPADKIQLMRSRYEHDWKNGNPVAPWLRKK